MTLTRAARLARTVVADALVLDRRRESLLNVLTAAALSLLSIAAFYAIAVLLVG